MNLEAYSGQWYELFSIPFRWQKGCDYSTAEYTAQGLDTLKVKNTCFLSNGKKYSRFGVAKLKDQEVELNDQVQATFELEFTDGLPTDGPSPYWIHWTDYEYALVGGPGADFLWLLGRDMILDREDLQGFLDYAENLGYNPDRVIVNSNVRLITS